MNLIKEVQSEIQIKDKSIPVDALSNEELGKEFGRYLEENGAEALAGLLAQALMTTSYKLGGVTLDIPFDVGAVSVICTPIQSNRTH